MDRYIGIDVHSQSCTIGVVGPSGKKLRHVVVGTNGAELREALRNIPGDRHICFEEGTQSAWLFELLEGLAKELVVCAPREKKESKSDEIDAFDLADKLRVGKVRSVFKAPRAFAGLRQATRVYTMLTADVTRTKNRLSALFRARGLQIRSSAVYAADSRGDLLKQLPPAHRPMAQLLRETLDSLESLRECAHDTLLAEGAKHPIVSRLATAPGIGPIRASQIVSIVIVPHRFRTKRQLWSYSGLGIITRSSADWVRIDGKWVRAQVLKTRGLNRNRNPLLKEVFKGAAHHVAHHMPDHPLHADYQRMLADGIRPNLALLTLARRVAAAILAM